MRTFAAAILAALVLAPQASYAWKGGPWSNGSNLATGTNGTYKATFTGKNLIGVTTFGSSDTTESTGRYFCWMNGQTTYGATEATIDTEIGRVAGVFMPVMQVDSTTATTQFNQSQTTNVGNENSGAATDNQPYPLTWSGGSGGANGSFMAKVTRNDYKFVFKGTGHMTQAQQGDSIYVGSTAGSTASPPAYTATNPGMIYIVSGTAPNFTTTAITVPQNPRDDIKFTISGTRTSTQAYTATTEWRVAATAGS